MPLSTPILEICTLSIPSQQNSSPTQNSYTRRDTYSSSSNFNNLGNNPFGSRQVHHQDANNNVRGSFPATNNNIHHHRTRHHHGESRDESKDSLGFMQQDDATVSNVETTTKFELDPNHPLRHIFATAPTKFGRRNSFGYRRKHIRHSDNDNSYTDNNNTSDERQVKRERVIIENIFVEPSSSSSSSSYNGFRSNSRKR